MIYGVTGVRAKRACKKRECVRRATTWVPETVLVPETRERNGQRLRNSVHSGRLSRAGGQLLNRGRGMAGRGTAHLFCIIFTRVTHYQYCAV